MSGDNGDSDGNGDGNECLPQAQTRYIGTFSQNFKVELL